MLCYVFLEIPNLHHFVIKMLTHLAKENLFYLTRNLRSDLYWFLFTDKKKPRSKGQVISGRLKGDIFLFIATI